MILLFKSIELASGIIAASLPSLRPLVRLVLSGGTTVGSSGQTPGSHQSRSWSKKRNSSLGYVKTDNTGNISLNNFSRPTVRYKPTGESLDADSRYILSKEAQMSSASFEEPFPSRQRSTAQCAVGNSSPMTRKTEFEDGRPHQIVRTTEVIINWTWSLGDLDYTWMEEIFLLQKSMRQLSTDVSTLALLQLQ